jgi:hypothetical protein
LEYLRLKVFHELDGYLQHQASWLVTEAKEKQEAEGKVLLELMLEEGEVPLRGE